MSRALDVARILEKLRRGEKLSDEEIELLLHYLVVFEDPGHADFPNIDRALARRRTKQVLKGSEAWVIMRRYRPVEEHGRVVKRVEFVLHQIFDEDGSLRHIGVKGVRGWSEEYRDRVDFTYQGYEYEFWHYTFGERVDKWRKRKKR